MLVDEIIVTNDDIIYAEKVLVGEDAFSDEVKDFIKDFSTCDLCAVPGAGKTTALLAKLICLEKYLPLANGGGILMLSHTNVAIDEIKEKLGAYCPKLLAYPNFIGTVQDFINTFFVKPYFNQHGSYGKIAYIDKEIYVDILINEFYKVHKTVVGVNTKGKNIYMSTFIYSNYYRGDKSMSHQEYIKEQLSKCYLKDGSVHQIGGKKSFVSSNNPAIELWANIFRSVYSKGVISYDLAYAFAQEYIISKPKVISLIRKRFPFVFLDEAQDSTGTQLNILETLFGPTNNPETQGYQRIGDPNQAIYHSSESEENDRINNLREETHILRNSRRFHKSIANIVSKFALIDDNDALDISIEGNCECVDSCICIKPYLIIYEDKNTVLNEYIEIIKNHITDFRQQDLEKIAKPFRAIGWVGKQSTGGSLRIPDYYPGYSKMRSNEREDYKYFSDYVVFCKNTWGLRNKQNAILRGWCKIIRILGGKILSIKQLMKLIKEETSVEFYEEIKEKLLKWCCQNYSTEIHQDIIEYILNFCQTHQNILAITNLNLTNTKLVGFIMYQESLPQTEEKQNQSNIFEKDGIQVHLGTVHSVKGETHIATLYLETMYLNGYDSVRGLNFLRKIKEINPIHKTTAKMMYVGLSRPTTLLCIAIHKDRIDNPAERESLGRQIKEI